MIDGSLFMRNPNSKKSRSARAESRRAVETSPTTVYVG
jgi:hypothetical protein